MNFRDFMEQEMEQKPWKARRRDVLQFWQGLQPGLPLQPTPIEKGTRGTRFRKDGLRITGSSTYINSVLSHLKEFLGYEQDPRTKLDVEYRQIKGKDDEPQAAPIFVCYVYVLRDEDKVPKI